MSINAVKKNTKKSAFIKEIYYFYRILYNKRRKDRNMVANY